MTGSTTSDAQQAAGGAPGRPLIVSEDERLLDDLLRLCAAAGAEPEVAAGMPAERGRWERAPLVLVGDDAAHRLQGVVRREGVLLIGRDLDDHAVWRQAVVIGADHVLRLPDAEAWLVDRIADAAEGAGRQALTVGVIGGRGGAGASTLACALALSAARSGRRTMLIDGDPLGGGLDVLLGGEAAEGLRWPAFAESRGRLGGGALEESLPELHSLRVLSWDRGDSVVVPPEAMRAVLSAARRRGGVVVVDLPRRVDDGVAEVLAQLDVGLLVVPAELRAVAAAHRVAASVGPAVRDLRVVVRGPCGSGLDDEEIARLLDLPLAGELAAEPGLLGAFGAGAPPGSSVRGPLAKFCSRFWSQALPDAGSTSARPGAQSRVGAQISAVEAGGQGGSVTG
ncbi:septum site-determining protein Ssd [Streptomyces sp. NPDC051776]|uniref:septum site-determining protein Ssd n=1 Tax=Streptomyces sp. NPDC051776 TaxID=3155414 RepID=UPI0034480003